MHWIERATAEDSHSWLGMKLWGAGEPAQIIKAFPTAPAAARVLEVSSSHTEQIAA